MVHPALSIVIATSNPQRNLAACLAALAPQIADRQAELLIILNPFERARLPGTLDGLDVRIMECETPRLIPERWGLGVAEARGRIIAITVSGCIPAPGWVASLLVAHEGAAAGVGGAIENAPGARLVDWGVFFARYTPYLLPFAAAPAAEIPGDNGSYKREEIVDRMAEFRSRGFWETDVNAALRAKGRLLVLDPRMLVFHKESFTFSSFSWQRFAHGRRFGRARAARSPGLRRWAYVIAAPGIPLLIMGRITRNVLRRRRCRAMFLATLPLTAWFVLCWSTGEVLGLIDG